MGLEIYKKNFLKLYNVAYAFSLGDKPARVYILLRKLWYLHAVEL